MEGKKEAWGPLPDWDEEVREEWEAFCAWARENRKSGYLAHVRTHFKSFFYGPEGQKRTPEERLAALIGELDGEKRYYDQAGRRGNKRWDGCRAYFLFCAGREQGAPSGRALRALYDLERSGLYTDLAARALTGEGLDGDELKKLHKQAEAAEGEGPGLREGTLFYFLRHRCKAAETWRKDRRGTIERVAEGLRQGGKVPLAQVRGRVAGEAAALRRKWRGEENIEGSRLEQLLLQMVSLKETADSADWFPAEEEEAMFRYAAELLAELYVTVLCWDGGYLPPRIMGMEEPSDWLPVLVAAPFTQILAELPVAQVRNYPKELSVIPALLKAGVIWVNADRHRADYPPLEKMPMYVRISTDCGDLTEEFRKMWTAGTEEQALLAFFARAVADGQRKLRFGGERSYPVDPEDPLDGLKYLCAILEEAPRDPEDEGLAETVRTLTQVVLCHCLEHIRAGSPAQGEEAMDCLARLCRGREEVLGTALHRYREPPRQGRRPRGDIFDPGACGEVLLAFPRRLLGDMEALSAGGDPEREGEVNTCCIYAGRAWNRALGLALERGDPSLAARAAGLYVQTMTTAGEAGGETFLMDRLRPCKAALERCRAEVCGGDEARFAREFREPLERYAASLAGALAGLEEPGRANCEAIFRLGGPGKEDPARQKALSHWATEALRGQAAGRGALLLSPDRPARRSLFTQWFLDDLDSMTVSSVYGGETAVVEARLMETLMEARNVVLTLPMLVDSRLMRSLTGEPEFLWAMRSGLVNVSPYGNALNLYDDLCSYAADQMRKTYGSPGNTFIWSSLSPALDRDDRAREAAAKFLLGKGPAPGDFREELEQFREALILFDENIPYESRVRFYQTGGGAHLNGVLKENYDRLRGREEYAPLCGVHDRVVEVIGEMNGTVGKEDDVNYVRSDYLNALDLLRARGECDPELLTEAGRVLNDVYKRMLAGQCPDALNSFPYGEGDGLLVRMRQDTNRPDDCIVTRKTALQVTDPRSKTWRDVMEFRTELAQYAARDPEVPVARIAEQLKVKLEERRLNDLVLLYAETITLRTSDSTSYRVEISPRRGVTHVETKGGRR